MSAVLFSLAFFSQDKECAERRKQYDCARHERE